MVITWFLSCCTSFAINQNDFQRQFGEMIPMSEDKSGDPAPRINEGDSPSTVTDKAPGQPKIRTKGDKSADDNLDVY
jgi:hypothetical protein